ncbi:MAG: hypothetical protein ABSH19_07770 [Opitutales bacterium]|jgi:hypothetical protein
MKMKRIPPAIDFGALTRRRFLRGMMAATVAANPLLSKLARAGAPAGSTPAEYTNGFMLPQTQSSGLLAQYLSSEHLDYDLDGWFFFGSLIEGSGRAPDPANIGAYFMAVQRIDQVIDGFRVPVVPAIVAFNGAATDGYIVGGSINLDIAPVVTVTPSPWSVEVVCLDSNLQSTGGMTMTRVSGQVGRPGAIYRLVSDTLGGDGHRTQTDVTIRDRMGAVNEGHGPASFFPQWITPHQREQIDGSYHGSVDAYLRASGNAMVSQGSYYYSEPLLEVQKFVISRDDVGIVSQGNAGTLWLDYVVETYNARAAQVVKNCSWHFFALQFPQQLGALMVLEVITTTMGSFPVATYFQRPGGQTRNGALSAKKSWGINEIAIAPVVSSLWTSPVSGVSYYLSNTIQLGRDKLVVTMLRENQEIVVGTASKYEGMAMVQGTLNGQAIEGTGWVELQPVPQA